MLKNENDKRRNTMAISKKTLEKTIAFIFDEEDDE